MSKNGVNNNGPALPPGITAEIWEQMKKQQRRGPVPPASDGQAAPAAQQKQQQQVKQQQQAKQLQTGSGKQQQAKSGKRVAVQIREANPVAVSNKTGSYEAIEIDSGVGNESNDEWKTVSRKGNRKKGAGDETAAGASVEKVANAVNGMQIAGDKKKKKKKPAAKAEGVVVSKAPAASAQTAAAANAGRKGSADSGKQKQAAGSVVAHQESEQDGDPVKRLRNLKKRLKEIELLRQMDKSTLGADQVEKMKRYQEVKKQIAILESRVN